MEIRKSSIEQAKVDFNEIKDFALNQARKEVENKLAPKLDEMINAALNESVSIESGEVKIEVPAGQEIKISKEDGSAVTISGESSVDSTNTTPTTAPIDATPVGEPTDLPVSDDEDGIEIDMDGDGEDDSEDEEFIIGDDSDDDDSEEDSDDDTEEDNSEDNDSEDDDNTIFEAEDLSIEDPTNENPDQNQDTNMTEQEPVSNPFEIIIQKLDALSDKVGGTSTEDDGQVEIVDDEASAEAPTEAPVEAPAAAPAEEQPVQEEFILEDLDEEIVAEIIDGSIDEYNELQPNMIPGEKPGQPVKEISLEEDALDEMLGVSQTVKHQANRRNEINESTIKAQYESTIDELSKENVSLKETIMEYKNSFVELRNQFNEMQTFNAKLAYANKLFMNGGLSTDEKMRISEQFDKAKNIEEAKDIFRNIVKENESVNPTKKSVEDKIKSPINSAAVATKAEPLFESRDAKRWKELAGIEKNFEE